MVYKSGKLPARPQAVLFDLDDTLITDGGLSEKIWREVCREFATQAGTAGEDELYSAINRTSGTYWSDPETHRRGRLDLNAARREVVGLAFRSLGLPVSPLSDCIAEAFSDKKDRAISLVAGAVDILKAMKEGGLPLALLTNGASDTQRSKIERFKLAPFFDCILIEGEFGTGKPDERVFRAALEKLNTPASAAWMVGDDLERDIAGAGRLGIGTIWVDWKRAGLPPASAVHPDYIINSLSQLPDYHG
jgi:putative hydrolase of the HAD superfamily